MGEIESRLVEVFSIKRILNYLVNELAPDLVVAALAFLAFYVLWRALKRGAHTLMVRTELDATAQGFVQTVLRYIVLTIGVVFALGQLGINTGSVLASLGVAGLTIGFAARDALSNIISGIFIFWDRPFVIGDLIEIGGHYGRVAEITMRSTRVVTVDGRMLAIPNTEIVNSTVASYTNFPNIRIQVDVTIGVNEDIGRARALLLELVGADRGFMEEPAPQVVVTALNDYNIELQLRAWIHDERAHIRARFALRERVLETLRDAGVEMPYQTFAVAPVDVRVGDAA